MLLEYLLDHPKLERVKLLSPIAYRSYKMHIFIVVG